MHTHRTLRGVWCHRAAMTALFITAAFLVLSPLPAAAPDPIRMGMVQSLFQDVPAPFVKFFSKPFTDIVKEFTGLNSEVVVGGSVYDAAHNLDEGKVHLVICHGYELAWAQQKYPDLRPLMVIINKYHHMQMHLVIRKDSTVVHVTDLRGKDVALPRRSKEHVRMFLERTCMECGQGNSEAFFGKVVASANAEVALDDVLTDGVQGAVVDIHALEMYEDLKPGCFKRLRILRSSEKFPAAAIVYRKGALDDATLERFRKGMFNANTSEKARRAMELFRITSFEPVRQAYAQDLADILKAYPPPSK